MGRKMLKEIRSDGSFVAVDDDGKKYIINLFTQINDEGTFEEPHATSEGLKILKTSDGGSVNYLDKGRYEIVQTGIVIQSSDPDAP